MAELRVPSVNHLVISGRMTKDPELKYTPNGVAVLNGGLASSRSRKVNEEWIEETTFIDFVVFGKRAESATSRLRKGTAVIIEGRVNSSSWESEGRKRTKIELIVGNIQLLEKSGASAPSQASTAAPPKDDDDDLPF